MHNKPANHSNAKELTETPMGRHTTFNWEMADKILELMADGESVRSIARRDDMPAAATIFKWLRDNDKFAEQYARACEMRADAHFEEMFEIADDATNDWMERNAGDDKPGWAINGEHIQRSRLRVDTRKWALSKMNPKKYGDKIAHTGGDGEGAVEHVVKWKD